MQENALKKIRKGCFKDFVEDIITKRTKQKERKSLNEQQIHR